MVVMQRNEVRRSRTIFFLTMILSVLALAVVVLNFSAASGATRVSLGALAIISLDATVLSLLQVYTYPKRSQVLLFQNDEEIVIATNALHEGFKLRFLRDILG